MSEHRYDFRALLDIVGTDNAPRRLSISGKQYRSFLDEGLTERQADRYAVRCGLVPYEVWPEMVDHLEDCLPACVECGSTYAPRQKNQRFCSMPCSKRNRDRAYKRRKRAADPEFAERQRAYRRAYYQECGDYERARERRKYHAQKEQAA